jgi:hypothetical protein
VVFGKGGGVQEGDGGVFVKIPDFASGYPERAETLAHTRLPFYCCNCQRKRETAYLTPDFGPFCRECLGQIKPLLVRRLQRLWSSS